MTIGNLFKRPLTTVFVTGFAFSMHLALTLYINSSFLDTRFSEDIVGVLFTAGAVLTLVGLSLLPQAFRLFGGRTAMRIQLGITLLALIGIAASSHPILIGAFFVIYFASNTLTLFGIDLCIEDLSDTGRVGKLRGAFITMKHFALMLAPLASGFIIEALGFRFVYGFAAVFVVLAIWIFSRLKHFPDPTYHKESLFSVFSRFQHDKPLRFVVLSNFLLQFFYAWMIIYVPIYLTRHIGLSWEQFGILTSIMLLPFVLFSYPEGRIADSRGGIARGLTVGFVVLAASVTAIAFITTVNFWIWALVLFMTRVGASIIEVMTETYFFKHIQREDVSMASIFRDTQPLAYLVAPLFASMFLDNFDLKYLFIVLGAITLYGIRYSIALPRLMTTIHEKNSDN